LTKQTIEDGWVHTGDIGYRDNDGYLYLKGRQKDIINVAGLKVSPLEIEAILNTHMNIKECACVEIHDPRGISGEAVKAFLVSNNTSKPNDTELVDFLRGKIEDFKIPSVFEWIKELPKTSNGKIQRYMLKN
jgi:long-chain acyl-CoA synthetase